MKKKISLKKLELKINKINDLKAINITGGAKKTWQTCPIQLYTDHNPGPQTSAIACYC